MPDLKGEVSPLAWVHLGLLIIALLVAYFFAFQSLSVIALKIARGQSIANERFFYVPKFTEYIKVFLFMISFIFVFLLLILLIIPGILFGLRYSQAYWIILEKEEKFSFNLKITYQP